MRVTERERLNPGPKSSPTLPLALRSAGRQRPQPCEGGAEAAL